MKFVPTFVTTDSDILKITEEMGFGEAIEKIDCIAPLFWPEEFVNDSYKKLRIDDYSVEEEFDYLDSLRDPYIADVEEYEEEMARAYILKALNKYAKENGITPDYILVDVSW
jgi:hypothetical protein